MPNEQNIQTVHLGPTGDPDSFDETTLPNPGELGHVHHYRDRVYQRVQLDSGATSSVSSGAPAANDLLFWKDRSVYLVTHDIVQAEGAGGVTATGRNQVAGVLRVAATAGNYIDMLIKGRNINIADGGNTFAASDAVIAENDTASAAARTASGTAPTNKVVGWARGAASGGVVAVDVDIPPAP